MRQRRGAQCPDNSSSGAVTCVSVVFESSSKQRIDRTVALKAERGPPWLLLSSGVRWRAVSADPALLIFLYFILSYPSPEHEWTHQQWWGKQPPCSEQPAHPWWRQRKVTKSEHDSRGKKYIWQRKCTSVNLPLRAAAEVQISSLQSMLGGWTKGGGEDRRKRWGEELHG